MFGFGVFHPLEKMCARCLQVQIRRATHSEFAAEGAFHAMASPSAPLHSAGKHIQITKCIYAGSQYIGARPQQLSCRACWQTKSVLKYDTNHPFI